MKFTTALTFCVALAGEASSCHSPRSAGHQVMLLTSSALGSIRSSSPKQLDRTKATSR